MIRTETREVYIVRGSSNMYRELWCNECSGLCDFLSIDHAANLFGIGTMNILKGVQMFEIHHTEIEHGRLFVCQRSLTGYIAGQTRAICKK